VVDVSPAAIKLAARHGASAQIFPANAAAADGRPRIDGVICWNRICAVAEDRSRRNHHPGNQQPQFPRRGAPKALGPPARPL
jgi:hypothetical protein